MYAIRSYYDSLEKTNSKITDERLNYLLNLIINYRKELLKEIIAKNKVQLEEEAKKIEESNILKERQKQEYIEKAKKFFESY